MGIEARCNPCSFDGGKDRDRVGLARLMRQPWHRLIAEAVKAWWERRRGA